MAETKSPEEMALQIADRATRRNELAEVRFGAQGGQLFVPTNGRELMDMANMMSQSGPMVKEIFRGNPGACMALIAVCAPYGLNPLQVSWHAYKASKGDDAPISYEAKVIVAMLNGSGILKGGSLDFEFGGNGEGRFCIAKGVLKDGSEKTIETPPLSQIHPKNSPLWKTDPDQQLAYYAGRAWVRRHRPEMMLGVYSVDEEPAIGPDNARDITPKPRGGVSYRDVNETPPPAASVPPEDSAPPAPEAEEAEVVDGAADDEIAALKATAVAKADRGKEVFIRWWNDELTQMQRAAFDQAALAALQARCAEADKAAEDAAKYADEAAAGEATAAE